MGWLLMCAALLSLLTGARSETQYILSTPARLVSGGSGSVCVNIEGSTEPLDVSISMEHDGRNTSIMAQDVATPNYFQCSDFPVPSAPKAVPVAIIFSAIGSNTELRDRKTVVINSVSDNCLFQMDKPTYKPGNKVLFRVLCLDFQLKPVNNKITLVYLQDPSGTRVAQWRNPESNHGVVSLEFQLIRDATSGSYILTAERGSEYPIIQWFKVEQRVLPRFWVDVVAPQTVAITAETIKFNVSSIYTYGEPVAGSVTVQYCKQQFYGRQQNCFSEKGGSCANMTGELGPDGTYSGVIDLSSFMRSTRGMSIILQVTVTEAGTGIQATESRYIYVTSQPARLSFDYESINQYYKRGLDYHVVARLTDESDQPIPNQEIEVQINDGTPEKAMTDSDGRVDHGIDTSNMVEANFTLRVSYTNPDQCYLAEWSQRDYPSIEYTVYRFYSYSGSFIQMKRPKGELSCGESHDIDVEYILSPEGTGSEVNTATFYYLVLSKTMIVQSGQKDVELGSSRNGSFSLDLQVSPNMAPRAQLFVYSLFEKELVSDTIDVTIEKCFENQVSMAFSEEKGAPGSKVDVQLSASPNSHCALRVIDSSLLILNPYEQFSADSVYNSFGFYNYAYNVGGLDVEDPAPPCEDPNKIVFYNGRYYLPVSSATEGDTYHNLRSLGLVVGTGLRTRKPQVCGMEQSSPILRHGLAGGFGASANLKLATDGARSTEAASIETLRTNFSETFLWVMVPMDTEGRATLSETVPDTITKWQGTAFCTSEETGFGMTRYPANYTTFLPFFAEMSLPYSFIRGETLVLIVVVRNFLEYCTKVQVILENSNAFTAVFKDGQQDACICGNGRASYSWEVQSNIIGELSFTVSAQTTHISTSCDGPNDSSQPQRKDTVVQTVIVEPEGIYQERTLSNLVYVENDDHVQLPLSITPPQNVVPGSENAYVTAVGDVFGLSIRGLEDLVQKPHGCGEQVLSRMAFIPEVLDYLNATGQLTEEILQKGKQYMTEGYYRILSFISGGAYKLFQTSESPNSWLTAYCYKTLERISKYIDVDEQRQQQTLIWLENSQRLDNGCFKAQGGLITIQDTDSDLHFTAYLATALLTSKRSSLGSTLLNGALECLKNASKSEQKITDQVLMLFAFTLANMTEYREPLLQSLMKKAKSEGGTIHWEREDMPKLRPVPFFLPPYAPAEIMITAYMLLSMAAAPNPTKEALTTMAETSIWLVRQQTAHGGFGSTQDTVVALQGLASFAQKLYTPNSQHNVVVRRDNADVATFNLNQDNRLVVHRESLPNSSGDYLIDVRGTGWCMIQTTVGYNIPIPKENSAFSLSLTTSSDSCVNGVAYSFTITGCLSYQGSSNESNMAIVEIRMLSGYKADASSLNELVRNKTFTKYEETAENKVVLYRETVDKTPIHFSFKALMGQRVLNVKSSSAIVYRYYEGAENGYAAHHHPCAEPSASS